ncbi:MFS transporter [Haliea sp. E17]|uniref:MFS transporter n=1 Tax=Haliea sp. E17 TaxID=3401576 RepID=UPI003AADEC9E
MKEIPGDPPAAVAKREILAWAFYDFANSGYTTVVLTTIYSAYFVGVVAAEIGAASPGMATLLWTLAIGLSNFVVLLAGPVVGALADYHASKKRFLLLTTLCCIAGTAGLAFAGPAQLWLAITMLVISATAFSLGENLIAAFLPEIATEDNMGRISGYGWGLGYFGGVLTLACCLGWIQYAAAAGMPASGYVPVTLLITAVIFAITATPTFLFLRERARPRPLPPGSSWLHAGFGQVLDTLQHVRRMPDLFRFLGCLSLFQAGVSTVVVIAAIFAQEVFGFDSQQLIMLIMVVNLTAAAGAFGFGHAQDRFGSVPTLAGALLTWIVAIAVGATANATGDVWLCGNLIGLAMGATQAGGRALIGNLTPQARNGEIFGLWGMANRAAAIVGPIAYGLLNHLWAGDHRISLLAPLAFFVAGLLLLFSVNERRGRAAALAAG